MTICVDCIFCVQQPEGYEKKGSEHKVLKLKKVMYGLHQVPKAWNSKLDVTLIACSSGQTHCIHCSSSSSSRTPKVSVRSSVFLSVKALVG
jgi:hypothetical protein